MNEEKHYFFKIKIVYNGMYHFMVPKTYFDYINIHFIQYSYILLSKAVLTLQQTVES